VSTSTELQDSPVLAPANSLVAQRLFVHWTMVPVVACFAGFYTYLSYIPLFYTDIWGHVGYGKWMLEHRTLPTEDPFLPLSQGMRVVDSCWLSQVFLAWAESVNGAEALSLIFAVTTWLTYVVLCRAFYLLSGRISLAMVGTLLVLFTTFGRHGIIRPEIFGRGPRRRGYSFRNVASTCSSDAIQGWSYNGGSLIAWSRNGGKARTVCRSRQRNVVAVTMPLIMIAWAIANNRARCQFPTSTLVIAVLPPSSARRCPRQRGSNSS